MKNLKITISLIFCLITILADAQQASSNLDSWMENNTANMGGRAVLLVAKGGQLIYSKTVNHLTTRQKMVISMMARKQGKSADLSDFTANTKIQIASCSKWLSAALVMTFVDEGKLSLTDTIGNFLPIMSKNGKGSITIAQCLSHTTGIKSPSLKDNLEDMRTMNSMDEAIADIAKMPMEGSPGTVFHYSNVGLQIAGAIIEKIGNKHFQELFLERIAAPLSMKDTDFGNGKVALPAGGASGTANDYLKFLTMVQSNGVYKGKTILSAKSISAMQVNQLTSAVKVAYSPAEATGTGYGFGEWVGRDNVSSPGLFGSYPIVNYAKGYSAVLFTFYLKPDGKQKRYTELKELLDKLVQP